MRALLYVKIPELNEMGEEIERDKLNESASLMLKSLSGQAVAGDEVDEARRALRAGDTEPATSQQVESSGTASRNVVGMAFKIKILVIQNIGIVTGFSFMLLMAIHSESINFQ